MEKKDKSDELMNTLSSLELLEEVPSDVSKRFHETLSQLVLRTSSQGVRPAPGRGMSRGGGGHDAAWTGRGGWDDGGRGGGRFRHPY